MGNIRPYLAVDNALEALNAYEVVFNAKIIQRMSVGEEQAENFGLSKDELEKTTMHAEFEVIGDLIYISDNFTGKKTENPNVVVLLEPDNLDQTQGIYDRAVEAGWNITSELKQQFWGDYYCDFTDPFGIKWSINFSPNQE